ncbi:MAG: hypothetical protein ACRD3W_09790, partial [Terriglobales bacterium]
MEDLFSVLVSQLGKSQSEFECSKLIALTNELPGIDDTDSSCIYRFTESGFHIMALRYEPRLGTKQIYD